MTQPFRVLISDDMSPRAADVLAASDAVEVDVRGGVSAGDLAEIIGGYDGLLVRSRTKVTAEIIDKADRLRVIGRAGIGVDNIDLKAASRRGILVENAPSGNSITTAEHAICLLLSLVRRIPQATASMKDGRWEKKKLSGSELYDKTFGVIGLGNIGRIVADRARGLKMRIVGFDPFLSSELATRLGIELVDLDTLLERSDFITIHTPLTNDTRNLLGAAQFAKMKKGAYLVNAARGGIVDESACAAALNDGTLAGAAFDVFVEEPPPADHPLVTHPKVICTPHLGASTDEAQDKVAVEVAEQMVAFAERHEVRNAVNLTSVPAEVTEQMAPWLELSRRLGSMVGQLVAQMKIAPDALEVSVVGDPAQLSSAACTNAVLVGLMANFSDRSVNDVNARVLADERGLAVTETKRDKGVDLTSFIGVTIGSGERKVFVKGTLFHVGDSLEARVVQIDGFLVEIAPRGSVLVVNNQDKPGVIGAVGTLLGAREINVDSLHVAHDREQGTAMALWSVGASITEELREAVSALPLITSVSIINLSR